MYETWIPKPIVLTLQGWPRNKRLQQKLEHHIAFLYALPKSWELIHLIEIYLKH
jgi:hypothetical protein